MDARGLPRHGGNTMHFKDGSDSRMAQVGRCDAFLMTRRMRFCLESSIFHFLLLPWRETKVQRDANEISWKLLVVNVLLRT